MVDNADVVHTLGRIADLLEIRGENSFKVRAYRMAAARVESLTEPIAGVAARDGGLRRLDGFGPAIAEKVTELLNIGHLQYLADLEAEIPAALLAVCELPGVGPRTAATLWREAGIASLDELEAAAAAGSLEGIPRLGTRSIERIVAALEARRRNGARERRPRGRVVPLAVALTPALRSLPDVERAHAAGSFRRKRETVKDLDVLVSTREPRAVLQWFSTLPSVERVLVRGSTKCSVEADSGFQVDCRAVAPEAYGSAMQYFTGSRAHNIRMRGRALRMGMLLNEYGLFLIEGNRRIAGDTERGVYEALGLRWIPPEEREHGGDIELTGASVRRTRRPQEAEAV
ncbi:MAG: hypothetical protein JOZ75_09725 [Candidatus Dormibacteraeota bacterium]|nr:hypothetical protein [Candidatus Dormibacteraeota bacterium]